LAKCVATGRSIIFSSLVLRGETEMTTMKATKTLGIALAALLLPHVAVAETWLTLEASEYPAEVKKGLDDVRSACKGEEHEVVDDPQAGVTIIDLDRDDSKDILLEAWRACSVEMKGAGCNTAGCVLQIFKQVGPHKWKSVFDETIDPVWFLSASQEDISVSWRYRSVERLPTDAPILRAARVTISSTGSTAAGSGTGYADIRFSTGGAWQR
jgi:hypothetical protein